MNRYIFVPTIIKGKSRRRYMCYANDDEEAWELLRNDIARHQNWFLQDVDTIYGDAYDAGTE